MANEGAAEAQSTRLPLATILRKLSVCVAYICVSSLLIRFNKWMMQKDHFPFALALAAVHMLTSSVLCFGLYAVRPSTFSALQSTRGERAGLLRWFIPIGACFAVMLYGSNEAYLYCSVTLLQFMKEANAMIVFLFSCIVGLQSVNRMRTLLIIWVITGSAISVSGDIKFSWVGVAFQAVSQLAECARMVMGEIVLTGRKLDPLTYTMFVAPICLVVLLVANLFHWNPATWAALVKLWPMLLANGCVAFALNVLVAAVIKEVSAVGFVLTGLTKDMFIVAISCIAFGEPITKVQVMAFLMTILGVGFWGLTKADPGAAPVRLLERLLCMPHVNPDEKLPLVEKKV